jgi:hypothetical protein
MRQKYFVYSEKTNIFASKLKIKIVWEHQGLQDARFCRIFSGHHA